MIESFVKYIENKDAEYVIFDIGSRDCMQSIEFYNHFPNAQIYAFECNPNTLDICRKNIESYKDRITLIEGAVCDYDGDITFYPVNQEKTITTWEDGNPGASSIFKSSGLYKNETYVHDEITTNCHRLDTIIQKYGISKVDIIWMDLQGAELLALKGMGNYLHNVQYIHTKVYYLEIYTNQSLFHEINDYLSNLFCFKVVNTIETDVICQDIIYENNFLKDPIFSGIDLTLDEQTYIRGKPREYILHAIKLLKMYTDQNVIVEIGSIRFQMRHSITEFNPACCNDGHSTYFWKHHSNAEIYTVDIDPNCKSVIDSDNRLSGVNAYNNDAFEFVKDFDKKIDLLFLDAWDVGPGSPYAEAHIEIYNKLKDNLSKNCIIIIDDTDIGEGGKGKLIIPQLLDDGFLMVINKRQTIFIKNEINTITNNIDNLFLNRSFNNLFDIVIPIGPCDKDIIHKQLEYTKKNIIGYRNIYLISYDPTIMIDGCITIDENIFPFNIDTVSNIHGKLDRNGWYLQQLLKLYAGNIIPNILERYLVIDSDTFFLKPTIFIENNKCLYNYGNEYHKPYFNHMEKLDPTLIKASNISGICHHMMFETKYINELITKLEQNHNDTFYNIFLKLIVDKERSAAGASEYEIYFNYILINHINEIKIRPLNWVNTKELNINSNYDYISYHYHLR